MGTGLCRAFQKGPHCSWAWLTRAFAAVPLASCTSRHHVAMVTRCLWVCIQAAARTNDTAGDGTTTATILSAAIIAEGMKIVAAGANPVQLTRGIERTVAKLVQKLQESSTEVTDEGLADVATVSAGNNRVVSSGDMSKIESTVQGPEARGTFV